MAKVLFARIAGALGVASLAIFFLGLIPFLSADPSAGAGLIAKPAFSVNRELKGDRLPTPSETNRAVSRNELRPRTVREIPVGCDPSFSPVTAPQLAYIFGRCTT
jgi:hypothetical protein